MEGELFATLTIPGPELQSQNRVDGCYGKTFGLGAQLTKALSEPKVEVISSKIDRVAAIYTSKLKWAQRAQFLSRTLQILEIN